MNKDIYIKLFLTLLFLILAMPSAGAWSWQTHSDIIDSVYYNLPTDVQQKLNLEIMRDGSNDPDEKFKDFTRHSFPKSYDEAKSWLDKAKSAYDKGDYNEASLDYGIATHYISDTFSAPHSVSKESSSEHSSYEDQAKKLKPVANYSSGDLRTKMEEGYKQGQNSWNEWLNTKNNDIIQNNLNQAASASLSGIEDSVNGSSKESYLDSFLNFLRSLFKQN
jgi:hypothetical protein